MSHLLYSSETDVDHDSGRNHSCCDKGQKHDGRVDEINARLIVRIAFHLSSSSADPSRAEKDEYQQRLSGGLNYIALLIRSPPGQIWVRILRLSGA
jgi:hypothetical protein